MKLSHRLLAHKRHRSIKPEIYFQTVQSQLSIKRIMLFKTTYLSLPFLVILCLAVLGAQSRSLSQDRRVSMNEGENDQESKVALITALAPSRARRSYFWVEDGSDKVTIVENRNIRRTLEDYRHKVHAAEKQRAERHRAQYEERREEYGDDEEVQEHTPLFVPNLFG